MKKSPGCLVTGRTMSSIRRTTSTSKPDFDHWQPYRGRAKGVTALGARTSSATTERAARMFFVKKWCVLRTLCGRDVRAPSALGVFFLGNRFGWRDGQHVALVAALFIGTTSRRAF